MACIFGGRFVVYLFIALLELSRINATVYIGIFAAVEYPGAFSTGEKGGKGGGSQESEERMQK